ncbi:MAG: 2-C-methyl-D-erythritol 4-phosphate cytidylyltransferase [Lachnospiraceae bacterium]|nr:2-C-methyl-D-erythritol 4-phosphate cytidylyltransferase [Lachnospiraceae bacterium]
MENTRHIAIVLAAGKGKRMGTQTAKQYLLLQDRPILYYSLKIFQDSFVDDIILVTGEEELEYCREEIVEKYGLSKVKVIVPGGKERYHSVYAGLEAIRTVLQDDLRGIDNGTETGVVSERHGDDTGSTVRGTEAAESAGNIAIYIHDGARPFITQEILHHLRKSVEQFGSAVAAMPVKDTIKIADADGFVTSTPDRTRTWQVQTPQCFAFDWIYPAYNRLIAEEKELLEQGVHITDDAMAAELYSKRRVHLVEADYRNIKITTPEDLMVAERFLQDMNG